MIKAILQVCVGVSDKFSGNMETLEFITFQKTRLIDEFFFVFFFNEKLTILPSLLVSGILTL